MEELGDLSFTETTTFPQSVKAFTFKNIPFFYELLLINVKYLGDYAIILPTQRWSGTIRPTLMCWPVQQSKKEFNNINKAFASAFKHLVGWALAMWSRGTNIWESRLVILFNLQVGIWLSSQLPNLSLAIMNIRTFYFDILEKWK